MQCSWCNKESEPATLPDNTVVGVCCKDEVYKYYTCSVCNKELLPDVGAWARRKFERLTCRDLACKKTDEIRHGRLCCEKAEYTNCVCARSYTCPEHGETHVGTHD